MGVMGWFMKRGGFSRPAFAIAFVLTPLAEGQLTLAVSIFGIEWLLRPIVIIIAVLIVAVIVYGVRAMKKALLEGEQ
jgi:TctA family transporter